MAGYDEDAIWEPAQSERQFEYEWDLHGRKMFLQTTLSMADLQHVRDLARSFYFAGKYDGRAEKFREMQDNK